MFKNKSDYQHVYDVVKKFSDIESKINKKYDHYGCYYFHHKDFKELEDKMEEKYLHDYFKNHVSIKTKKICEEVKLEEYKKYMNSIKNFIYKKYTETDNCCLYGDCPSYINYDD
ncbi:VIR-like CYIR protein [Plasmodium cynomolgi strain B]|uniref:VIR-like CYIR protein n=1 Tax=Plasmodium cynomolgi (strain B) TaxID=1120755 RepID=K6UTZ2_PLACD|nr:VIR-like CYIR protein [Plasmodium cynomolgi strain B]GAB65600.1 VIR-like CYIR protein [Plasmodium cynomolgi strain B]